jgi:hypothetical protein
MQCPNRGCIATPPDFIDIRVEELTGDRPFGNLDDFISQEELRALSDRYKRVAGYNIEELGNRVPHHPREICRRVRFVDGSTGL